MSSSNFMLFPTFRDNNFGVKKMKQIPFLMPVRGKPIRDKVRFGCVDAPVRDADWLIEYSVGLIPVGDIRIEYIRDPVDREQSTDAAPLTELLIFYTVLHLY